MDKKTLYSWQGKNKRGRMQNGTLSAVNAIHAKLILTRRGLAQVAVTEAGAAQANSKRKRIVPKDIALFTRQLATMMQSGVPLLQSFDLIAKGHANLSMTSMLQGIKSEIEMGHSLSDAFSSYPDHFDRLFCNLVQAGEQAGILDTIMARLASYQEKIIAIKGKIKSAMTYPIAIITVAFIVTAIIMIKVVPAFKTMFSNYGATLPTPTLITLAISDFFVSYWWLIFGSLGAAILGIRYQLKHSESMQKSRDKLLLRLPVMGAILEKAAIARISRTFSTMLAAGVPMVDALLSVAGAAGNWVYASAILNMREEISHGTSLTNAMENTHIFPNMVIQMVAIGENSGSLDVMLSKVADYYDSEVDDAVAAMSSLMEPIIMAFLGLVIGGLVISMYLPIFKMGDVV